MKKKQIKLYFSDDYSDSSIKVIVSSQSPNENQNQNFHFNNNKIDNKIDDPNDTDEEYPDGNNPFVIQDTSPFELSSSTEEDYSEPSFQHKSQSEAHICSPIENFYNQTSSQIPYGIKRHSNYTYSFSYKKIETIKGPRFHYQLSLNENPLFHSKAKLRHPNDPVRISSGSECHFSQHEYEGYLLTNKKRNAFSLRSKTKNGPELMIIELSQVKGPNPKNTRVIFKNFTEPVEDDSANNKPQNDLILVNMKPKKEEEKGHWTLNFNGKFAIPSVKNCILVKECTDDQMISMRRVSTKSCEIDAFDYFPPLCLFALGLSSFVSSI